MQACSSVRPQDDGAVDLNSAESQPEVSPTEGPTSLFLQSSLHENSNLEDTLDSAQHVSVHEAFAGRTVLLTGVTGFVGSLVLEQLLRTCPDVHKVFVIARQKHGISGPDRVQRMLHSHPLFYLVRAQMLSVNSVPLLQARLTALKGALSADNTRLQSTLPQVEVLAGDMTLPGYGIGEREMRRLKQETEIVIHAAASISFDDHIHDAITHNYMATKHLADMAAEMPKLRAFVHVSTAYVNGNQPKGSTVAEHMLPRGAGAGDHVALVNQLQALPKAEAASQAGKYMQQWRFPNTYCFSKHLAELLMASYHGTTFPLAIVRPSIIGGLAGTPLPGYVGNTAGSTGAALAIATGIAAWTCHQPSSVFDVVPGDLVSSTILAAAAAATTQGHKARRPPLIVHACTSSQNFMTTGQFFQHIQAYFTLHPPPFRVILGGYPKYQGGNIVHTKQMLAARSALAEAKFVAICTVLRISGRERLAKKLYAGWKAWQKYNSPALDFDLCFCTHNSQRLQQLLPDQEQQLFRLCWGGEDWQRYMTTYMAGIRHSVLKQPTLADPDRHDFAPWPDKFSADGRGLNTLDVKPAHA
ncbi:Fatty acyl-CoA reductase 2 [Trebouxia sp. C0010 RCD-2024]